MSNSYPANDFYFVWHLTYPTNNGKHFTTLTQQNAQTCTLDIYILISH